MKFVSVLMIAFGLAHSTTASAISLSEVSVNIPFERQEVLLKIKTDFELQTMGDLVRIDLKIRTDLSDLQNKFDVFIKNIPLATDNCPGYGQHVLPKIEQASLKAVGMSAVIEITGNASVWDCQKNPIRTAVVKSEQKCLFGVCIDVPTTVEWRDSQPIKNKYFTEGFSATIPLTLTSKDGVSIDIKPGNAVILPRGELAKYFNSILAIFNNDLSRIATNKIDDLVETGLLKKTIPQEFMQFNPILKNVSFTAQGARLFSDVSFSSEVSANQLSDFLKAALRK
jgi:hypothetical protein